VTGDRATSFGAQAETYDRYRPSYPPELIADLLQDAPRCAVDVGCGTAIAGRLLVARGVRVVGVEPDARMAAVATQHGVEVVVSTFEDWAPAETFDLLTAAQSWHWVHPVDGPAKAAAVLRSGGRFAAFWNSYSHSPAARAALTAAYERHAPHLVAWSVTLGTIKADDPLANDGYETLDHDVRARLLDDIADVIATTLDGELTVTMRTGLVTGRRR
jgi:SAM-dependent methyltransferase